MSGAALLLVAGSIATGSPAAAVEAAAPAAEAAPLAAVPQTPTRHFFSPDRFPPWAEQRSRWFLALEIDTGFLYVRPRLSLGLGRAHHSWLGVELNPILSEEGVAGYAGLRVHLPFASLRAGGRYWWTFYRSFLEPRPSYSVEDIELRAGPRSQFLTGEVELSTGLPLGPGAVLAELAGSYVTGVADGRFVYEETLRVVVDPPWVWRARAGYLWEYRSVHLGPVVEVVGVPGRDALVLRAGALVRISLAGDLEARGTFVPAVATPDALGARGGDAFLLGVRYRWATD